MAGAPTSGATADDRQTGYMKKPLLSDLRPALRLPEPHLGPFIPCGRASRHPPDSLPILLQLPFGLADLSGYWTALVAAVISYAFSGLDAIADELQAFADTPMIVPLDATARALELGILEMLGQKQLPPPM
jgi:hypothetical protein